LSVLICSSKRLKTPKIRTLLIQKAFTNEWFPCQ
jgi:hypothetical protein